MSDYFIATASTSDLSLAYVEAHNIPFISYTFEIDGKVYQDDLTPESRQFLYTSMRNNKQPHTAAVSMFAYHEFFKELMETGKDVIYVDMCRALSSSIGNCEAAMKQIRKEFPHQRITFLDSYCVTGGLGLLVKQLVKKHEEGCSFDEVVDWGEQHKMEYIHRFMVNDLQWLRKGGRLSNASAIVGSLLSIKPIIYVDLEGKLVSTSTVRGRKKCLKALLESMAEDINETTALEEITVISADDEEDCKAFAEAIRSTYPSLRDAEITITVLGPVIASHVGPDFVGLTYHGKRRIM